MATSIIFDTNCFWNNYDFNKPLLSTTLHFCYSSENYQFVIPNIIKDEIKSNFREQLEIRFSRIITDITWYNKYTTKGEEFLSKDQFEDDVSNYSLFLDQLIDANDILELSYPEYSHQIIVNRNSQDQKPFSENDSGYKDTLIWLNILDHLQNTKNNLIFVTKNNTDFGSNNELHNGLLRELDSLDIDHARIQYFSSKDDFFEEIIKPQLEVLDIIDQIRNNEYERFSFYDYINDNVFDWFIENQDEIDLSSLSNSLERPIVDMIDDVELIELNDGKRLSQTEILLEYNIGALVNCDILIDRHMPPRERLAEAIHIFNYKFNPSYMEGEIFLNLGAKLLINFNPISNEVLSTQLKNISADDYV